MAGTLTISTLSDGTNSTSSTNAIKGSAKAWAQFNGSTLAIAGSYNISSITRTSTARYTVTFTAALPNAGYSVVGGFNAAYAGAYAPITASSFAFFTNSAAGGEFESTEACFAVFSN